MVDILPAIEPDWVAIENQYRAGVLSLRVIAAPQGITEGAIRKRAIREEWVRDLKPLINERTQQLVRREYARCELTGAAILPPEEEELVEAVAQAQSRVLLRHKRAIEQHANLASTLLDEVAGITSLREDFEQLGELLYAPDEKGVDKLNEIYKKVMAVPGRVDAAKKLGDNLKTLVVLERQVVGLSDNSNGDADKPPVEANRTIDNDAARRIAFLLHRAGRAP